MFHFMNDFPLIKLFIIMFIVPIVMNSFLFWVQDNVLKKKSFSKDTEEIEEKESHYSIE